MKRFFLMLAVVLSGWSSVADVRSQDASQSAAAIADRQEAEERYRRLNSAVEDLTTANVSLQKRLAAVTEELQQLREEMGRSREGQGKYASQEDLHRLVKKLQEVDDKREADKKLILDELQKLLKMPPAATADHGSPSGSGSAKGDKTEKGELKGYEYVVKSGDVLSNIVEAYREKGVKVTTEQVVKANPKLRPNRLIPGQKIFIPDPALR